MRLRAFAFVQSLLLFMPAKGTAVFFFLKPERQYMISLYSLACFERLTVVAEKGGRFLTSVAHEMIQHLHDHMGEFGFSSLWLFAISTAKNA